MFRLSRQTKILSPALIHRRIWFRGFHDVFTTDGTGNDGTRNDGTRNDGHGSRSDIFDHGTHKVDIIKSIHDGNAEIHKKFTEVHKQFAEVHKQFAEVHKQFADWRSDQKLRKWEIHFLFFGALSV
ncbi:hypothetical protein C7212DRAFT_341966 [Tuber magnatum]|uniref:Uncharacterized protein n=1 Tax=Tuber magnatum TaxID=42249 RepID=A0A317T4A8_9PEZI|nr:hypothetical protein C7212DRAFT_341966 [Tuber magnatum]